VDVFAVCEEEGIQQHELFSYASLEERDRRIIRYGRFGQRDGQ